MYVLGLRHPGDLRGLPTRPAHSAGHECARMGAACGGARRWGNPSSSPSVLSAVPSVMLPSLGSASTVGGIRSRVRLQVLLLQAWPESGFPRLVSCFTRQQQDGRMTCYNDVGLRQTRNRLSEADQPRRDPNAL